MRMAETEGVEIMDHNIIYKLTDDVKRVLSDLLPPTVTTRVTGEAEIREIFEITVKGREKVSIAGSRVRNGMINKARKVRVLRGEETLYDGKHAHRFALNVANSPRYYHLPQKRQEGRYRNA